jgi:hypothetical protein
MAFTVSAGPGKSQLSYPLPPGVSTPVARTGRYDKAGRRARRCTVLHSTVDLAAGYPNGQLSIRAPRALQCAGTGSGCMKEKVRNSSICLKPHLVLTVAADRPLLGAPVCFATQKHCRKP